MKNLLVLLLAFAPTVMPVTVTYTLPNGTRMKTSCDGNYSPCAPYVPRDCPSAGTSCYDQLNAYEAPTHEQVHEMRYCQGHPHSSKCTQLGEKCVQCVYG